MTCSKWLEFARGVQHGLPVSVRSCLAATRFVGAYTCWLKTDFPTCVTDCAWRLSDVCARLVSTKFHLDINEHVLFSSFLLLTLCKQSVQMLLYALKPSVPSFFSVNLCPFALSLFYPRALPQNTLYYLDPQHMRLIWEMSLLLVSLCYLIP